MKENKAPNPTAIIIWILSMVLVVAAGMLLSSNKAGASATVPATSVAQGDRFDQCKRGFGWRCHRTQSGTRFHHRVHHGQIDKGNGFKPSRYFEAPKATRRIAIRRITNMLNAVRAAGTGREMTRQVGTRAVAKGKWVSMVNNSPCTKSAPGGYPAIPADCVPNNPDRKITREAVVGGLVVVGCSTGLVAGIMSGGAAIVVFATTSTLTMCAATALSAGGI